MVSQSATKTAAPKKTKTTKSGSASKKDVKANAAGHPSWKDMIKECIAGHPDDARSGVSRATIKKFISEKYDVEINGTNLSQLNRAITHGAEHGIFALPKGPSGKVKLAPKVKPTPTNENVKPLATKKTNKIAAVSDEKPVAKKIPVKSAPVKKALVKKVPAKKTATSKKTSSAKIEKKKPVAKAAAIKAKPTSKAATKSKSSATAKPASTRKPKSAAKPKSTGTPKSAVQASETTV